MFLYCRPWRPDEQSISHPPGEGGGDLVDLILSTTVRFVITQSSCTMTVDNGNSINQPVMWWGGGRGSLVDTSMLHNGS